jgi:hypothetical protein
MAKPMSNAGARSPNDPRLIWMDVDCRPRPKTEHHCVRCQRDLKPGQPHRWVCLALDGMHAWAPERPCDPASETDLGMRPIGMDCARKIGLHNTYPA